MPRLQTLLKCVACAIRDTGARLPDAPERLGSSLLDIARLTHLQVAQHLPSADLRAAIREAVSAPLETVELSLRDAVIEVAIGWSESETSNLTAYLELIPALIRQHLRRPDDPAGNSVPEQLTLQEPADWLPFLPDRLPRLHSTEQPANLDNWQVTELRGFGIFGETWRGWDHATQDTPTACLKFITEPSIQKTIERLSDYFQQILDLEPISGLVPLRSLYLAANPPCLESQYVSGYDLAGLMRDWSWRYQKTRPDQASLIIRRIAKIVGKLHTLDHPWVHRGLKPSNILLHPTSDGKVGIWVSDIGWGAVSSAYCLKHPELCRDPRQIRRGGSAYLYASPEQKNGEKADPRDDVYALGTMWYQLLKRDPTVTVPEGNEWAMEFRKSGLTDSQAMLIAASVSPNRDHRPANASILADLIAANAPSRVDGGSKSFQLKGTSSIMRPLSTPTPIAPIPPRQEEIGYTRLAHIVEQPQRIKNSIGMMFGLVPAGAFLMGSPENEKGRQDTEGPSHRVTIQHPFYLGLHPVTQSQFRTLMGKNPSHFQRTQGGGPDHPVEQVSWDDAVTFCERLSALHDEIEQCHIYRLPSEAEWEYACRAGTTTPYSFGETVTLRDVHFFGLSAVNWAKEASSVGKTRKVGTLPANPWGFYDMHGNVLEWCADWWSADYYSESPEEDPPGPIIGSQRVVRGGSFSQFVAECRSASRLGRAPESALNMIGFRVAIIIPPAASGPSSM